MLEVKVRGGLIVFFLMVVTILFIVPPCENKFQTSFKLLLQLPCRSETALLVWGWGVGVGGGVWEGWGFTAFNLTYKAASLQLAERQGRVVQSVGHLTHKSEVLGSISGLVTYFPFSFC